jgi:uncharacterized protein (TIGR02246 family)
VTEEEISRLYAERACERLMYQYARFVDSGHASGIADLFTEDGTWTGADGRGMNGQAEVRAAFAGREALTRRLSRHVITNVLIDVQSPDEATGIAYLINYRHDRRGDEPEGPASTRHPKFVGDYHLRFRRVDGEWRIQTLRFDLLFLRRREVAAQPAGG